MTRGQESLVMDIDVDAGSTQGGDIQFERKPCR
jgi:DNA polymerase-3 subunit epsilon